MERNFRGGSPQRKYSGKEREEKRVIISYSFSFSFLLSIEERRKIYFFPLLSLIKNLMSEDQPLSIIVDSAISSNLILLLILFMSLFPNIKKNYYRCSDKYCENVLYPSLLFLESISAQIVFP